MKTRFTQMASFLLGALLLVLGPSSAQADIYKFVDENGVTHFSNVPVRHEYEVFVRDHNGVRPMDPDQFDMHIRAAAEKYGLEFELIKAVIKVESSFDPRAVSPQGAKGLMQIMPGNYASLGIKNPFDPAQNINAGAMYLQQLMEKFDGSLSLTLAAYNAGPSAVLEGRSVPNYAETQAYVLKVMDKYYAYRRGGGSRAVWQWAEGKPPEKEKPAEEEAPAAETSLSNEFETEGDPGRHTISLRFDEENESEPSSGAVQPTVSLRFDEE